MTVRIPASLNWLVTKRARLAGEIKKAEVALAKRQQLEEAYIDSLRADLKVIDQTIRLHEIQLDPQSIPAIATQTAGRDLGHGAITRAIYASLRKVGNEPRSTRQIALYLCSLKRESISEEEFVEIRYRVAHRLRGLCTEGKIERIPRAKTNPEIYWKLKKWDALSPIGRPKKVL